MTSRWGTRHLRVCRQSLGAGIAAPCLPMGGAWNPSAAKSRMAWRRSCRRPGCPPEPAAMSRTGVLLTANGPTTKTRRQQTGSGADAPTDSWCAHHMDWAAAAKTGMAWRSGCRRSAAVARTDAAVQQDRLRSDGNENDCNAHRMRLALGKSTYVCKNAPLVLLPNAQT